MSIELQSIETSSSGRRLSFTEAIEAGKSSGVEEETDAKQLGGANPESPPYDSPPPLTSATTFSYKMSNIKDLEIPFFFKSKIFWIAVLVVLGIAALLVIILVPLHFSDLDYWEVCTRKVCPSLFFPIALSDQLKNAIPA